MTNGTTITIDIAPMLEWIRRDMERPSICRGDGKLIGLIVGDQPDDVTGEMTTVFGLWLAQQPDPVAAIWGPMNQPNEVTT